MARKNTSATIDPATLPIAEQPTTEGVVADVSIQDIMAGDATFTVETNQTGTHYTYRVTRSDTKNDRGVYTYFVKLLTGDDNESAYTYMGLLVFEEAWNRYTVKTTKASKITKTAQSYILIDWLAKKLSRNLPYDYNLGARVLMAGKCLRCGRKLTLPSSIEAKYGRDCQGKLGL